VPGHVDDVQSFVTKTGIQVVPVCDGQFVGKTEVVVIKDVVILVGQLDEVHSCDLVTKMIVGTVTGGRVCVTLVHGVDTGQKLGQIRDLEVLSVLLQQPIVVVKLP
jgi:hypothetical protein